VWSDRLGEDDSRQLVRPNGVPAPSGRSSVIQNESRAFRGTKIPHTAGGIASTKIWGSPSLQTSSHDTHSAATSTAQEVIPLLPDPRPPTWIELTAFQRDCLEAVARRERTGRPCDERGIVHGLERRYPSVTRTRLEPNLRTLVGRGLLENAREPTTGRPTP